MKMNYSIRVLAAATVVSTFAACSSSTPHVGESTTNQQLGEGVSVSSTDKRYLTEEGKLGGLESAEVTIKANVTAIDRKERVLTLSTADGQTKSIKAGSAVRNFDQIKVGDLVSIGYVTSVAFETREPTAEELRLDSATLGVAGRAKLGNKPGAYVAAKQVKVVTVASVNKEKQLITIQDLDGAFSTVKAKYPENLSLVKEGDRVVLTLSEAVAAKVTPLN